MFFTFNTILGTVDATQRGVAKYSVFHLDQVISNRFYVLFLFRNKADRTTSMTETEKSPSKELSRRLSRLKKEHETVQKDLEEKKRQLDTVLNSTSDVILRIDSKFRYIYVNPALYTATGFKPDEYIGFTDREIGLPEHLCRLFKEKYIEVFDTQSPRAFEFDYPTRHTGIRTFQAEVSPEFNNDGEVVFLLSCMRDITDIKAKDTALDLARQQWQQTFDSISDWISIIDNDCRFLQVNERCRTFTGSPAVNIINHFCHDIITNCPDINPCPLETALKTSRRVSREIQRPDGKWWLVTVDPILNGTEPPSQAVHIVRDITMDKLRETQTLQAKKNAAFRVLAGGIAHDYNNLLAVIMGNISLAIDSAPEGDERLSFLKEAENSLQMARDLSHKFLAISGYEYSEKNIGRLNPALESVTDAFTAHEKIKLKLNIDSQLWPVNFDTQQMHIVFQNILINGMEAMPGGGTLTLRAENIMLPRDISSFNYFKTPGGGRFVKIEIEDTGTGIPEQLQSKIFDPYFSTKQRGVQKGMGLGLAVVSSILENHGGTITIDSQENKGTRFSILIPAYDPKRVVDITGEYCSDKNVARILVMDDEMAMRKLMGNIIRSMGYRVELTENSKAAVNTFYCARQENDPFDLVILDQIINGSMGGSDTLKRLKSIDAEIKAIVISGSPHSPTMTNYREYGFHAALIKPYTRNEVHELIHQLLQN